MAKRDINKVTGKYAPNFDKYTREHLEQVFLQYDKEQRKREKAINPPPRNIGNRLTILDIYRKTHSMEEVYKVLDEINKKFGREVYTKETVDIWINEEFGISNNEDEKGIDDDAR